MIILIFHYNILTKRKEKGQSPKTTKWERRDEKDNFSFRLKTRSFFNKLQ